MTHFPDDAYLARLHDEVLLPCVRIRAEESGGSGTVLYHMADDTGEFSTYILTNHHVVAKDIHIEKKWSALLKREIKTDVTGIVNVDFHNYRYKTRTAGANTIEADIAAYAVDEDLALLKLRLGQPVPAVAKLPRDERRVLPLGAPVYAVGGGMGEPPIITAGMLTQFGREIENKEFWMSNAPTIFGNSGGALFDARTHEFIGVPARVAVQGFGGGAVPHLSYAIPITRVRAFLDEQKFRFILDPGTFTERGEEEERRRIREEQETLSVKDDQDG
jgi:S1-C subfamily serine protease